VSIPHSGRIAPVDSESSGARPAAPAEQPASRAVPNSSGFSAGDRTPGSAAASRLSVYNPDGHSAALALLEGIQRRIVRPSERRPSARRSWSPYRPPPAEVDLEAAAARGRVCHGAQQGAHHVANSRSKHDPGARRTGLAR
jgi:hypothetical protein